MMAAINRSLLKAGVEFHLLLCYEQEMEGSSRNRVKGPHDRVFRGCTSYRGPCPGPPKHTAGEEIHSPPAPAFPGISPCQLFQEFRAVIGKLRWDLSSLRGGAFGLGTPCPRCS